MQSTTEKWSFWPPKDAKEIAYPTLDKYIRLIIAKGLEGRLQKNIKNIISPFHARERY